MARPSQTLTLEEKEERTDADHLDTPGYASTLASIDDKLNAVISELVNRKRRVKPVPFLLPVNKVTPAGPLTFNFLDLGGPPTPNRTWNVMRYSVNGIDPFTPPTGTVFPFIASVAPNDSNTEPIFPLVVDVPVSMDRVASWSGHQLTLRFAEHLILCFKGVPANTQIFACIQGEEQDLNDFRVDRD